jgi:hypothetical protein
MGRVFRRVQACYKKNRQTTERASQECSRQAGTRAGATAPVWGVKQMPYATPVWAKHQADAAPLLNVKVRGRDVRVQQISTVTFLPAPASQGQGGLAPKAQVGRVAVARVLVLVPKTIEKPRPVDKIMGCWSHGLPQALTCMRFPPASKWMAPAALPGKSNVLPAS